MIKRKNCSMMWFIGMMWTVFRVFSWKGIFCSPGIKRKIIWIFLIYRKGRIINIPSTVKIYLIIITTTTSWRIIWNSRIFMLQVIMNNCFNFQFLLTKPIIFIIAIIIGIGIIKYFLFLQFLWRISFTFKEKAI